MILVSGFNVYPNEIEDVVMQHPGVQEVAAVGVPSGSSGEAVKIFVVKKDPSLTEESLVTFCRRQLTGYKVPKLVVMSYRNLTSEKFCDENYVTKRAAKWTIKPER